MADPENSNSRHNLSSSSESPTEMKTKINNTNTDFLGQKVHYPNPPDKSNPDPATLRDQWRFAIRQYSKWYSHAWGTAILAGVSFFALGWIIKGSNPLPSRQDDPTSHSSPDPREARP